MEKALQYAYRDRRNKKRDMRGLWIQRINAGTRQHGVCQLPSFANDYMIEKEFAYCEDLWCPILALIGIFVLGCW